MAAAAAGLVWATLLMCVALGSGLEAIQIQGIFPGGVFPPPVMIYCKQNTTVNVAIRNGKVVLANANCRDKAQKWFPYPLLGSSFSLLNVETLQVITIPSGNGQKVGLSSTNVVDVLTALHKEMWTQGTPTSAQGFYQLFVKENPAFTLNGLLAGVRDGTEVGIYSASPVDDNTVWKLTPAYTC